MRRFMGDTGSVGAAPNRTVTSNPIFGGMTNAPENGNPPDPGMPLLTTPASDLSPEYLRIDPTFKPLYGNPRFERMAKRVTP